MSFGFLCCQFDFCHCWQEGVCMFKMFGFSHGNFFLPIFNVITLIEKMSNFFVIPASTDTNCNSAYCWYVSKYELTWSSNPRTDSVTLIVQYCLIRQTKIGMSFVGKLHQICLYFFIIMQIKDFAKICWEYLFVFLQMFVNWLHPKWQADFYRTPCRWINTMIQQLMWLSGRPMLLVAEVRGSIPAKHRGWSRR